MKVCKECANRLSLMEVRMVSEADKREELRRIVRDAVHLHREGQLNEVELRDIAAYAISLEITDSMNQSMSRLEQNFINLLERSLENVMASYRAGVSS